MSFIKRWSKTCSQLDRILSIVPSLKPSNIQEIENVNRLYQAIAEAQLSINYVLLNDKTGQVDVTAEQQLVKLPQLTLLYQIKKLLAKVFIHT